MDTQQLKYVLEAALLAAGKPLDIGQLRALFGEDNPPEREEIREALAALEADYAEREIMLKEVASGFRIQARPSVAVWLRKLWEERPPRYSRALMETLAIIAYRQPVTRGDVENIRGVGVTTNIMRTLLDRCWVRVVGYRDVPGKPAMYGTTRDFLDYFGLQRLDDLPPLADLRDLEYLDQQLQLQAPGEGDDSADGEAEQPRFPEDTVPRDDAGTVATGDEEGAAAGDEAEGAEEPLGNVIPLKAR
ncbi:MAG: SMC-Scp complex subunit ScpB [Chromatiales bacterium]|nr:SMC-Scp complex subunit ScpB [Chromatiales bacterium]